jgi:hypothetical protein
VESVDEGDELHQAGAGITLYMTLGTVSSTLGSSLAFCRDGAQADLPGWAVLRMHLPTLDLASLEPPAHGRDRDAEEAGSLRHADSLERLTLIRHDACHDRA